MPNSSDVVKGIGVKWIGAIAVCASVSACSFHASVGTGAREPEPLPAEPEAAPARPVETRPSAKANVKVVGSKLQLTGNVMFQADSAELVPSAENDALLGELARYLEQNARVTRVRIEGHTHNQRDPEASLQLSGQRASAVKQWLRRAGINEGRLLAVGFGETRPAASNADAQGQAQNERVEFRIAELDGKPYMGTDPLAGGTEFP